MRSRFFQVIQRFAATILVFASIARAGGQENHIPLELLFGNPERQAPTVSPDGSSIAYLAPQKDRMHIWVRGIASGEPEESTTDPRTITEGIDGNIIQYVWAPSGESILVQVAESALVWQIYAIALEDGSKTKLLPESAQRGSLAGISDNAPHHALLGAFEEGGTVPKIYRVDLRTGKPELAAPNEEGFSEFLGDQNLRVRLGMKTTATGGWEVYTRDDEETPWRKLLDWPSVDVLTSGPIRFSPDGQTLYFLSSAGANTAELRSIDVKTSKERTIVKDPRADIVNVLADPTNQSIQAVKYERLRGDWFVIDPDIKIDFRYLRRLQRGDFNVISRDHADKKWIVQYESDVAPVRYYLYDRPSRSAKLLFDSRPELAKYRLAKIEPFRFRARDGLQIGGYITIPCDHPPEPLPTVVYVHGGPWIRDSWGYSATAQWLANRGYVVLQVNFRGSKGQGKDFINAGNLEWGGKMQTDLEDAVRWAVEKRITDPSRVGIMGGGYGGYAALMGMCSNANLFRCAVAISAPTDLLYLLTNPPQDLRRFGPILYDRIGHPEKNQELLVQRSPISCASEITGPVLIGHSAGDQTTPIENVRAYVAGAKRSGEPVEFIEFPEDRPGLGASQRLEFFKRAEAFFAEHLGGDPSNRPPAPEAPPAPKPPAQH